MGDAVRAGGRPETHASELELFRIAALHASDLLTVHALDGAVLFASPSLQRFLGIEGERARDAVWHVHPCEQPALAAAADALARGEPRTLEVRVQLPRGSYRWVEMCSTPWRTADGAVAGWVTIARDVHGRRNREDALRKILRAVTPEGGPTAAEEPLDAQRRVESELRERARQQQALAEIGEMAMFAEDPAPLLRATVRVLARTLGVELVHVLELAEGGDFFVPVASTQAHVGALPLPVAASHAGAALAWRTPVVTADLGHERRFSDERLRQIGISSGICVVLNGRDRPNRVLGAHSTEPRIYTANEVQFLHAASNIVAAALVRHEIAAELRAKQDQLRAVFDHALEALITVSDAGIVLDANSAACRLLGRGRAELVGQPWITACPQRGEALLARLRRERRVTGEDALRDADGEVRDVQYAAVADAVPGVHFVAFRDLSVERRMQAQLALADRMVSVGTLAAGVAHELNNPLAYVAANLAYVAAGLKELPPGPRADLDEAVAEARQGAERMRAIIRDLGTFSRGDDRPAGPVPLTPLLESCIGMAWNEVRHRARLVRDFAPVPPVRGAEARLAQVFLNLLVNAAQAIPEGDASHHEIAVAIREAPGGRVAVEVRDTGCGIPPENAKRIFDPFFTTKPPGVGMGLGLSICHNIVASAGGSIEVESAPGRGTTFRVLLPVDAAPERAAPRPARQPAPAAQRSRVLVVDDEPLVASAIRRALGAEHEVRALTSAREALAAIEDGERFDAILSDLLMPEMTGMELHRELTARHPALAERMVFITGGAFTTAAREFLERNRAACVEKPFDVDALRALVRARAAPGGT